ncbi:hypothetical protein [Streptomyces venezuelae]|uniref:hypothetical protein n=1 Tax=Streptomyces venezuelae TaxID=54571 RepID=UPI00123B3E2D|nr:hypothetical protein [Streptomyces venezuelae]
MADQIGKGPSEVAGSATSGPALLPRGHPAATRWQAGAEIRCTKISTSTPGCTFHKYIPTWVMNFNKTLPAVEHAWLIQAKLPTPPGSKAANKPLFFLPAKVKNQHQRDPDDSRKVICPNGWAATYGNAWCRHRWTLRRRGPSLQRSVPVPSSSQRIGRLSGLLVYPGGRELKGD